MRLFPMIGAFVSLIKIRRALFFTCAMFVLTACITTTKGSFEKETSVDAAVAVRVNAAKQYLQGRDFESAKRHLKTALELDAQSPDVHDALALTFHASGEIELAEQHYRKAIKFGKGKSRYRINYANYLFQKGDFQEASEQLEVIAGDSLYAKRESALVLLGLTQLQLLQEEKALRSFERALILNPKNRRVLRELSIINYDSADYRDAWQHFQQYRKLAKRPTPEMLLLGIQLARKLEEGDAEASYALALKNLYPESREYQSYLRELNHRNRVN